MSETSDVDGLGKVTEKPRDHSQIVWQANDELRDAICHALGQNSPDVSGVESPQGPLPVRDRFSVTSYKDNEALVEPLPVSATDDDRARVAPQRQQQVWHEENVATPDSPDELAAGPVGSHMPNGQGVDTFEYRHQPYRHKLIHHPETPVNASPTPWLTSIHATKRRGPYGSPDYRGNCSGYLIKDLLRYFSATRVLDPMTGSGTCRDVCQELDVECVSFDLHSGKDASNPLSYEGIGHQALLTVMDDKPVLGLQKSKLIAACRWLGSKCRYRRTISSVW